MIIFRKTKLNLIIATSIIVIFYINLYLKLSHNHHLNYLNLTNSISNNIVQMEKQLNIFLQLQNSGQMFQLRHHERELTLKYWELRTWLKNWSSNSKEAQQSSFFDFDQLNLWEPMDENDDRIIGRLVWTMQVIISRLTDDESQSQSQYNNKNKSKLVPQYKRKSIFMGDFHLWDEVSPLNVDWRLNQQTSCATHLIDGHGRIVHPNCDLIQEIPNNNNWSGVDAILSFTNKDRFWTLLFQQPSSEARNLLWFKYTMESPYITPIGINASSEPRQFISSYLSTSLIPHKYIKWVYYDPLIRSKPQDKDFSLNKTKLIAIFISNCAGFNNRLDYVAQLSTHIQVDVYGKCSYNNKSCGVTNDDCYNLLRSDYKFYLAFENANCKDYVSEKFHLNALGNHVIPIVMGAPRSFYQLNTPQNSYIHVEDFKNPKELSEYLKFLSDNSTAYNAYFSWIGTGEFINQRDWLCSLCSMLYYHDEKEPPSIIGIEKRSSMSHFEWLPNSLDYNNDRLCLERNKWYWDR